jgi:nicotinamidase-related amidase
MQNNTQALILVDLQNDYFPGGKNELEGSPEAGFKAARVMAKFRLLKLPLVHIQHLSTRPGATFFIPGTTGAEIHETARPLPGEVIFQKHFPNSFRETPLLDHLHQLGITQLVIAGMMTHMCVDATTRAANDFGFDCLLAHDACATRTLKFKDDTIPASHVHGAFLAALSSYAKILSVEEILAQMGA